MKESNMETTDESESSGCCLKVFEYIKNRNRIGPGRIELPECDFFIVGPGRTLRVLRPTPKIQVLSELPCERPESIHENFISRWTKRPHSSGHCRCSFRQSSRYSTNEERIITAEINRIRTSLCEAEKSGQNIDEIEQRLTIDLNNSLNEPVTVEPRDINKIVEIGTPTRDPDDLAIKNKIVKDLEKYIDVLLEEVLNDSMKFINDADDTLRKSRALLNSNKNSGKSNDENKENVKSTDVVVVEQLDIKFAFPVDKDSEKIDNNRIGNGGYVNEGFVGSAEEPDCLDFDLRKPIAIVDLEKLDCIDSGINSVETVEFQPEPEISLEQSLMQIIDEKFGKGPLVGDWQEVADEEEKTEVIIEVKEEEKFDNVEEVVKLEEAKVFGSASTLSEDFRLSRAEPLDEPIVEPSFVRSKLELKPDSRASTLKDAEEPKKNVIAVFCQKFTSKISNPCRSNDAKTTSTKEPVELRDYRAALKGFSRSPPSPLELGDVVFRRDRKPLIVFIHGFGSSAEAFEPQLKYFRDIGYSCIAPEMMGHGLSSAPTSSRDYHFDRLLEDYEAILEHYAFKPGLKCVLVAHNYGCSFATALTTKYEKEIHQLVLISGGGPTPLAPPSNEGSLHACLRAILSPLLMCGLQRNIMYSARGRQHPYCGNEPQDQWPSHMKYILNGMIWPEGDYVYHRRICTPTLLIHGLRDNKVSLVQECQMERTIVKAFLEAIPTAGHFPMTDTPDQVNHMIHCFIDLWTKKRW